MSHLGQFRIYGLFYMLVFFSVNFGWSICVGMLVLMCWHVGPGMLACWFLCVGRLVLSCWFVDPGFVLFDEEYLDLWVPCLPESSLKTIQLQFESYLGQFLSTFGQLSSHFGPIWSKMTQLGSHL